MRTYFISDLHFNHKNILKYEQSRVLATAEYMVEQGKFETLEEANNWINYSLENDSSIKEVLHWHTEMLIDRWNKTVKDDDVVWFLGDLTLDKKKSYVIDLVSRLKGHKRMVIGNHDVLSRKVYEDAGFEYVSLYPVVLKKFFILSHEPVEYLNESMPMFNIYGHIHSHSAYQTHTSNTQCVCVERQDFKPVRVKEFDNCNS